MTGTGKDASEPAGAGERASSSGEDRDERQGPAQGYYEAAGHPHHHYYHPYADPYHMAMASGQYGYPVDPQWAHMMAAHYGYQYPLQQMEGVPLPPGIAGLAGSSSDPLEAVLGPFPCARLRNLPFDAALEDILLLFQGLVAIDILLVGQGEAFVIFANPMDFQMALQRSNRQAIARRSIEITAASRADYYDAVASVHFQSQHSGSMSSSQAMGRVTAIGGEDDRQPSGDTVSSVLWGGPPASAPSPQSIGSQSLSTQSMGTQSLGSQPLYGEGMAHGGMMLPRMGRPGLPAPLQKRTGGGIQVGEHTGFLRMRGLPFSATREDIFTFFQGYNPLLNTIVLTFRNDGRATGEAYVGFATPDDAKRAMDLHRRSMGSRYIELFISNKEEQGRALARFGSR